jgi:RNA polymerase sigma-70 factor (ECF subfamily)
VAAVEAAKSKREEKPEMYCEGKEWLASLFLQQKEGLRRAIRARMDRRLHGRIDPSDVLQEAYVEAHRRQDELAKVNMPPSLWLRLLTRQKLVDLHRHHLKAQKRSAGREVALPSGSLTETASVPAPAQLDARQTSVSQAAMRAEKRLGVERALSRMAPADREVLAMRHFEGKTNSEVAQALNISPNAASNRYVRALARMKDLLANVSMLTQTC